MIREILTTPLRRGNICAESRFLEWRYGRTAIASREKFASLAELSVKVPVIDDIPDIAGA
jgi:hypothetical protein